ncbi:MAG: putative molybdenum carrier protein [Alphaproteobacteria bacterium]
MTGLRVISGGQTGVDRAALDAARAAGLAIGGWCPRGRLAEDGTIPAIYPLRETPGREPAARTRANVAEADATLILVPGADSATWGEGTRLTREFARDLGKPFHVAVLRDDADVAARNGVRAWLRACRAATLNVAGPRESIAPGIYALAHPFLVRLFATL